MTYVTDFNKLFVIARSHHNVPVFGSEALERNRKNRTDQTPSKQHRHVVILDLVAHKRGNQSCRVLFRIPSSLLYREGVLAP